MLYIYIFFNINFLFLTTSLEFILYITSYICFLLYFNFDSLENLLGKIGFKILMRESTFPIDIFLLMGIQYVSNDKIGRECHGMRKTLELNLKKSGMNNIKRQLYKMFSQLQLGRETLVLGQK